MIWGHWQLFLGGRHGVQVDNIVRCALCFVSLSEFECRPGFFHLGTINIWTRSPFAVETVPCLLQDVW